MNHLRIRISSILKIEIFLLQISVSVFSLKSFASSILSACFNQKICESLKVILLLQDAFKLLQDVFVLSDQQKELLDIAKSPFISPQVVLEVWNFLCFFPLSQPSCRRSILYTYISFKILLQLVYKYIILELLNKITTKDKS